VQEEQSLVGRAQQHDEEAFAQLYERYFDKIYRYISLKIGDKFEAEDMTQQVFLKALKSLSSFKWKDVPFSAWLYRIAHNQIVDYFRKRTRRPTAPLEEAILHAEEPGGGPQAQVETICDMERLVAATSKLTAAQREVIALRFSSDLPIADVSRIMGKSEGAVKALQHSAILALRRIMVVD
jgi:RNA polymerase sigma-70 factor (ECF subfamily)